ncbi:ornithine carbamoyltransferase [Methylacidiphilum caldifontis]|uniref:Ornithine carbamoyltransferase n=1 Tax=Methylacidiphilum caldifontis TaxID=2795386 RepID=A0A4Y8PBL7_9BACT|nr:ornithine carbamoyltransferase [Methylacidiphilum caldifontis]TFE67058.1 ornithine carbamoyltransferase [Methylacidiphilum caldifontis]
MKTLRHFLSINDMSEEEARVIFKKAEELKAKRGKEQQSYLGSQTWALLFKKPSTRTRLSFEVAVRELGGEALFLNSQDLQLSRGESIEDTAHVLGRMVHGLIIRTYDQKEVELFATYGNIPVINALTDDEHPCQVLSDIFSFEEKRGSIKGKKIAFIGDGCCNVAKSWALAAEKFGFSLWIYSPLEYFSPVKNAFVKNTTSVEEAAQNAALLYTDVWISMGKEEEKNKRQKLFSQYRIDRYALSLASKDALVFHCLPAYRDQEISSEIFDERKEEIYTQAENRLHVQKALLAWIVGKI